MADILLEFGVTPSSKAIIQSAIDGIVKGLNPKIKVEVDGDIVPKAANKELTQLDNFIKRISKDMNNIGGNKNQALQALKGQLGAIKKQAEGLRGAMLSEKGVKLESFIKKYEALIAKEAELDLALERSGQSKYISNLGKDSAALEAAFGKVEERLREVQRLRADLSDGKISFTDPDADQKLQNVENDLNRIKANLEGMPVETFNRGMADCKNTVDELKGASTEFFVSGTKEFEDAAGKAEILQRKLHEMQSALGRGFFRADEGTTKQLNDAVVDIDNLVSELQSGKINVEEFNNEYAKLSRTAGNVSGSLAESTTALSKMAKSFVQMFTAYRLITMAWQEIKKMTSAVIELDSAMTQLQIVTGATDRQMKGFFTEATDLAKELGRSITEVLGSIETFSRLGYSLEDASVLTKYAQILSNVADTTSEDATTGLTSIIKGYNMDVESAEHVADVLVQVGQKYAVSASEMITAYEKSSAALSATNTSFEKSAGIIAAANAAVQNSSTVGTALKTVSARIRGSKSDLAELGEDVEELADGFSKYAEEFKALTGFDIMVEGTTNQFKDLYDIFDGVAAVWDKLSDTQQARVSEILGGTRQLQVISSILANWEDAVDAYADAMDSAGVATAANDIYMESVGAHVEQFKATFQELSSDMFTDAFLNRVVDFGKGILEVSDAVAKLTGGVNEFKIIVGGLSLTGLLRLVHRTKDLETGKMVWDFKSLSAFFKAFKNLGDTGVPILTRLKNTATEVGTAFGASGTAALGLGTAIGAISVAAVGIAAVSAIVRAVKAHMEELRESARAAGEEFLDNQSSVESYKTRIAELKTALDEGNLSEDEAREKRAELLSIQGEIIDNLGSEAAAFDILGDSIGKCNSVLDDFTQRDAVLKIADHIKEYTESAAEMESVIDTYASVLEMQSNADINESTKAFRQIRQVFKDVFGEENVSFFNGIGHITGTAKEISAGLDEVTQRLYALERASDIDLSEALGEDWENWINDFRQEADSVIDTWGDIYDEYIQMLVARDYGDQIEQINAAKTALAKAIAGGNSDEIKEALASVFALDGILDDAKMPDGVHDYFKQFIDALRAEAEREDAKIKIKADFELDDPNGTGVGFIQSFLKAVKNESGNVELSDILSAGVAYSNAQETGVWSEEANMYSMLVTAATMYKMEVGDLINYLVELGHVQGSVVDDTTDSITSFTSTLEGFDDVKSNIETLAEAFESLDAGELELADVIELIEKFPSLAEYVDFASDSFGDLATGIQEAMRSQPKAMIENLKEYADEALEAGEISDDAAQNVYALCRQLEAMPEAAITGVANEYGEFADVVKEAQQAVDKLNASLSEDTNEGYVTYAKATEELRDLIDHGATGSESKAWDIAEQMGITAKSVEELEKAIELRERWYAGATDDRYSSEGIQNWVEDVAALGGTLEALGVTWEYVNGELNADIPRESFDGLADAMGMSKDELAEMLIQLGQFANLDWEHIVPEEYGGRAVQNVKQQIDTLRADEERRKINLQLGLDENSVNQTKTDMGEIVAYTDTGTGNKVVYKSELDGESAESTKAGLNEITENANTATSAVNSVQEAIDNLKGKKIPITVNIVGMDRLVALATRLNNLPTKKTITVTTYNSTVNRPENQVNGTAHAGGNWGVKHTGTALTGELGREIVVRGDRWFTVGDNGAEFVKLRKGDIVFNHKQAEALLKNGYITGRGQALASGSAYAGLGVSVAFKDIVSSSSSSSSSSGRSSSSSSSKKSSSSSSDDDDLEVIDWIETAIDRLERVISNLDSTAKSSFKTLSERLTATSNEIDYVTGEIKMQQEAYERYMKEASSVGLDADLAQKVRNGTIDIESYSSETAELINQYKEWYEKALDCAEAVSTLSDNLAELYSSQFDAIREDAEHQITLLEHGGEMLKTMVSDYRKVTTDDIKAYYSQLATVQQNTIARLRKEYKDLQNKLAEAVASGEIRKGTAEWYEMAEAITSVSEEIVNAEEQLHSLRMEELDEIADYYDMLEGFNQHYIDTVQHFRSDFYKNNATSIANSYQQERELIEKNLDLATEQAKKIADNISSSLQLGSKNGGYDVGSKDYYDAIDKYYDAVKKQQTALEDLSETYMSSLSDISEYYDMLDGFNQHYLDTFEHNLSSFYRQNADALAVWYGNERALIEDNLKNAGEEVQRIADEITLALQKGAGNGGFDVGSKDYYKAINEYYEAVGKQQSGMEALAATWDKQFKATQQGWETQIDLLDHAKESLSGLVAEYRNVDVADILSYYTQMREVQTETIDTLRKEYDSLSQRLTEAVASEQIQEGSEQWYEMVKSINAVEEAIADAEKALHEFNMEAIDDIESHYAALEKFNQRYIDAAEHYLSDFYAQDAKSIQNLYDQERTALDTMMGDAAKEYEDIARQIDEALAAGSANGGFDVGSQDYYDAMESLNAALEKQRGAVEDLADAYKNQFNAVSSWYDMQLSYVTALSESYQKQLSDFDETSIGDTKDVYKQIRKLYTDSLTKTEHKLKDLIAVRDEAVATGRIEEGSAEWYEMSTEIQNVRNEVEDLHSSMSDLFNDLFSNIEKFYEARRSFAEALQETFGFSRYESYTDIDQALSTAAQMVVNEREIAILLEEINALNAALDEAVANGDIAVGSTDWYNRRSDITAKQTELADLRYANSELWEEQRFNSIASELDAKIDEYKQINETLERSLNDYAYMSTEEISSAFDLMRTNQRASIAEIERYIERLKSQLQDAVDHGRVAEGSPAFQELTAAIEAYETKLYDARQALAGYYVSEFDAIDASYQNQLELASESEKVSILTEMYRALANAMSLSVSSGEVAEGSEAWYAMQIKLNNVQSQIFDAQQAAAQAAADAADKARQNAWDLFDYIEERLGDVTAEAKFLLSLLEEYDMALDSGKLSDAGISAAALHSYLYDVYMSQARDYADEIKRIDEELGDDSTDAELIKRREELLELQRDSILAAQDERDAIVDLVKEGIDLELNSLQDLITAYNDSLDSAKSLYDYQKKISEQTANIAKLQKQLSAYSGDTSEENRARLQKLQVSLAEAQQDLQESEYEHRIQEQKDILDSLYDSYEDILNSRLDDVDALIADVSETINANTDLIRDTILAAADKVGYELTDSMSYILSGTTSIEDVLDTIREEAAKAILEAAESASYTNRVVAADIISIEQQRIDSLTNFLQQFVDQGSMTQERMNDILAAFGEGTEENVAILEQIVLGMVQAAEITEQQGNAIFAAIHQGLEGTQSISDMLAALNAAQIVENVTALVDDLKQQNEESAATLEEIVKTLGEGSDEEIAKTVEMIGELIASQQIDEETARQICETLGMTAEDITAMFEALEIGQKIDEVNESLDAAVQENTEQTVEATDAVEQQVEDLNATIAEIQERLDSLTLTVESLESVINGAAETIASAIRTSLTSVGNVMAAVASDLSATNSAIGDLRSSVSDVSTTVAGVEGFNTGGAARYTGLAKLDGTPSKPEIVLNQTDSQNLIELKEILAKAKGQPFSILNGGTSVPLVPQGQSLADLASVLTPIDAPITSSVGDINIMIDHVDDYNDLVYKFQHDSKFEELIQDITIGQIGASAMTKYRHRFKQ